MTNVKTTKKALLSSAVALLLCFAMLMGTTFAWFTDSATSGSNVITSGNLDIVVDYTLDGATWKTLDGANDLFQKGPWEPGHTEVVAIRVTNNGSLALKYSANMNITEELKGKTKDGKDIVLSEILTVETAIDENLSAVTTAFAADGALANAKTSTFKAGNILASSETLLQKGEIDYIIIKVDMAETVGNEANHNGKDIPEIRFGINFLAAQYTKEIDSFGPNYDQFADYDGEVSTAAALVAAAAKGGTYKVSADIALEEAVEIPAGVEVKLDLNGKTVEGTVDTGDDKACTHTIVNNGTLTISNGSVASSGINGGSAIYNGTGATLVIDDVVVTGAPSNKDYWPSYAINNYGNMTINGATITSNHGAIGVAGDTVINDATVTVNGRGGSCHIFYIEGNGVDLVVNGGTYTHNGNVDGSIAYIMTGTTMTVNGGTFSASNGGYGIATYTGSLIVNGGTFANAFLDWGGPISIAGGTHKTKPAAKYIADGYSVDQNADGTYTVFKGVKANDEAALDAALKDGKDTIVLGSGDYVIPASAQNKTLTIVGNGDTTISIPQTTSYEGCDYFLSGSNVTFENVVIKTDSTSYTGYAGLSATYKNCTFNGTYNLYGDSVFENCTFNISGDAYNLWTWAAPNVTFINCTFNSDGKALLLYGGVNTKMTVEGCTFNDNGGLTDKKAAIEIGNDYGMSYELIVNNTTVNGYEINDKGISTGTTLWGNKNSMGTDKLNVVVDGVDVY